MYMYVIVKEGELHVLLRTCVLCSSYKSFSIMILVKLAAT